jgi:hypothetical protein
MMAIFSRIKLIETPLSKSQIFIDQQQMQPVLVLFHLPSYYYCVQASAFRMAASNAFTRLQARNFLELAPVFQVMPQIS